MTGTGTTESAFYLPLGGDRYQPTEHTAGPWTPDAQHFGPPSALLARALEGLVTDRPGLLARVTVEILGPAPLTELSVRAGIERPGRSVQLLGAELHDGTRAVARASAWWITESDSTAVATEEQAPPSPEDCAPASWPDSWRPGGYLGAMEWRGIAGSPAEPGPAWVWGRQRVELVAGEKPTPLQRLFAVADTGNGASNYLDPARWWFINSELTVHLRRAPVGEWMALDARTAIGPAGVGTAASTLSDVRGPVGQGAQALMVRTR
ncbi:thioesterase family protein [Amycolatopsis viridis]|nr:thioesterase family protein [Amycolatopsis viridis]